MDEVQDRALTEVEAAEVYGVSRATIRRLLDAGTLGSFKIGTTTGRGCRRIWLSELRGFSDRQRLAEVARKAVQPGVTSNGPHIG